MRFRPANISLINRRHYLLRLLLTLSSERQIQKPHQRFEDVDRVTPYQGRIARDTDKLGIAARGQTRQFFSESEVLGRKGVRAGLKHMRISNITSSTITKSKGGTKTNSSFSPLEALNLISQ